MDEFEREFLNKTKDKCTSLYDVTIYFFKKFEVFKKEFSFFVYLLISMVLPIWLVVIVFVLERI